MFVANLETSNPLSLAAVTRKPVNMAVSRQVCPFHADEDIRGVPAGTDEGSLSFTCARTRGHPHGGMHSWLYVLQPDGLPGIEGYAENSASQRNCLERSRNTGGKWIEYGVAERAYALRCPDDFAAVVGRYGHTAVKPKQYTASAFLAGVLGVLSSMEPCSTTWDRRPAAGITTARSAGGLFHPRPIGLIPSLVVRQRPGHVVRPRCGSPVADSPDWCPTLRQKSAS